MLEDGVWKGGFGKLWCEEGWLRGCMRSIGEDGKVKKDAQKKHCEQRYLYVMIFENILLFVVPFQTHTLSGQPQGNKSLLICKH